jgi:hypothetical protein
MCGRCGALIKGWERTWGNGTATLCEPSCSCPHTQCYISGAWRAGKDVTSPTSGISIDSGFEINELLRAALIHNTRMTREALQSGFDHEYTCCSQVEKLIVQYAGPGPLSIYGELDIHQYSKMFHGSFRVAALSSESSMSVYCKMFEQTHRCSEYLFEV